MIRKIVLPISHIVSYIILSIGLLVFIIGLVVLGKGIYNKKHTLPIEAKVMTIVNNEDEREQYTLISYSVDGKTYTVELPYLDPSLDIGSIVTVYYFVDNPSEISGSVRYQLQSVLLIAIGLLIVVFKSIYIVKYFKEKKRIEFLLKRNKYIEAEIICVEEIEKEISYSVVPKIFVCEYEGKELKSSLIWEQSRLNGYVGHKVKIYYEDSTFNNYYVDYTKVR